MLAGGHWNCSLIEKGRLGLEPDDWFSAERELVSLPQIEIAETDKYVEVGVALPGFKSEEVEVFVEPRSVTIKGRTKGGEPCTKRKLVKYADLRRKEVFRPDSIAVGDKPG